MTADEDELRERARKVRPSFTEGPLVRVAGARNQAEAEFIQGLLLEEGIPSMLRRTQGFDVPDFLAAGPRDVLVPQAGAEAAHEVLRDSDIVGSDRARRGPPPARLLASLLGGTALIAVIAWAGAELLA